MDQMLDNISLYWFTNTGGSSARLYWELGDGFTPGQVDLPVGVSLFPREILRPSRRWVEVATSATASMSCSADTAHPGRCAAAL